MEVMHWLERRRAFLIAPVAFAGLVALSSRRGPLEHDDPGPVELMDFDDAGNPTGLRFLEPIRKSAAEWKAQLSPQQFYVTRQGSTDSPFTGTYHALHTPGLYRCVCCGAALFRSADKFDSGTGWPSFTAPADPRNIAARDDVRLFLERTEVLCRRCSAHLGHVFLDGPPPSGLRYCINESALRFTPFR
jgi:peptide-methionine (R)-S-oxide reductase